MKQYKVMFLLSIILISFLIENVISFRAKFKFKISSAVKHKSQSSKSSMKSHAHSHSHSHTHSHSHGHATHTKSHLKSRSKSHSNVEKKSNSNNKENNSFKSKDVPIPNPVVKQDKNKNNNAKTPPSKANPIIADKNRKTQIKNAIENSNYNNKSLFSFYMKERNKQKRNSKDDDILLKSEDTLRLLKESWLTISSHKLNDESIYPTIHLPNFDQNWINTGPGAIRLNRLFDERETNNPNMPPSEYSFWFRISYRNFYYTADNKSLNALGSIEVLNLKNVKKTTSHCFQIYNNQGLHWELCAQSFKLRNEWICLLKKLLNQHDLEECNQDLEDEDNITYIDKKVIQPIILIPQASPFCNANWNYDFEGENWECDCKEGLEQSPINLPKKSQAIASPVKPVFSYEEVKAKVDIETFDGQKKGTHYLKIRNSENVLQINHEDFGKVVTLDGAVYKAQKIVFHTPSEHTISGKQYDMEMQIIHYGQTKGDVGKQLSLSFLFEKSPGTYNKFIDDLDFFDLPTVFTLNKEKKLDANLYIPKIFYDSNEDDIPFMKDFSFYTYQGSLSFPPCTQNTIVYVASEPILLGTTALQLFHESLRVPDLMDSKGNITIGHPGNSARKTQPLNGRNVFHYEKAEECNLLHRNPVRPKRHGHYEKVNKKINQYFYVNNSKPSGLPGALVVSKEEAVHGGEPFYYS